MSADKSLQNLFHAALEREDPVERVRFLDAACGADSALRARVERLLSAREELGDFMAQASRQSRSVGNPLTEKPGDKIGRYKLLQQIGEGGCGVVYMAEQEDPVRRRVALKVIKLGMDTKQVIARFEAERQALALMDHPNIAKVFDAGATGAPVAAGILPAVEPGFQPGGNSVGNSGGVEKPKTGADSVASPGGRMPPSTAGETPAATLSAGRPYFVMELVRGTKITEFCDENKLSTEDRLKLFIQVCQAIQHAHQKGVIHRDIKPSNILVTVNDGVPVPKVIDFGIAKATAGRLTDQTLFTAFEQFIGTPAYMSPEQAVMTSLDIDTRSDIYSLGVLLYELLTGSPPFDQKALLAAGLDEMRRTIREVEPLKPSTRLTQALVAADVSPLKPNGSEEKVRADSRRLLQEVRGDLDWIAMKCLEKDRARRYETANALAMDIRRHLDCEPVVARPPSRWYEFQKTVRRHKFGFAATGAVIMALLIGLGISTWQFIQKNRAYQRATRAEQEQTRQRQLAEGKEKQSQQVAQFLKDMLASVEPSVAMGRDTEMLRDILDRTAERVGKDLKEQPEVEAELRSIMGGVYDDLGDTEKAEAMLREALRIRREVFGEEDPAVAESLVKLCYTLWRGGKHAEAQDIGREAVNVHRAVYGTEDMRTGWALDQLSNAYGALGKQDEAEAAASEALKIQRKLAGTNGNTYLAYALARMAAVLSTRGQRETAEALLRETVAMQERIGDTREYVWRLGSLAGVLSAQGRWAEAEAEIRKAIAIERKTANLDALAYSLKDLGRVLTQQGRLQDAEAVLHEDLQIIKGVFGGKHRSLNGVRKHLGDTLQEQGRHAEAETIYRQALAGMQTEPVDATLELGEVLRGLTYAVRDQGRLTEAEALARESVVVFEKTDPSRWRTFEARSLLGSILLEQHHHTEAEPLLRSGYEGIKMCQESIHADGKARYKKTLERLVKLYEETARPAQAAEWKQKLAEFNQAEAKK